MFEDIRIEPFFGPRRGGSNPASEGAGGEEPETSSPLRRLTGNAIESARNGARRILKNGAEAVKRRKPLLNVKNKGMPAEVMDEEDEETFAPSLPPISLLKPPPRSSQKLNAHDPVLMQRASALMSVLGDFGVKGRISGIYPGPVITLFELEPARGNKVLAGGRTRRRYRAIHERRFGSCGCRPGPGRHRHRATQSET